MTWSVIDEVLESILRADRREPRICFIVSTQGPTTEDREIYRVIDTSQGVSGELTERILEAVESRTPLLPGIIESRPPFVSKAMAWLRLSEMLIGEESNVVDVVDMEAILLVGYGGATEETRREIFRLLRFYMTYRPSRPLLLLLRPDELPEFPEEWIAMIPPRHESDSRAHSG